MTLLTAAPELDPASKFEIPAFERIGRQHPRIPDNMGLIVTKQELIDYAADHYDAYTPNDEFKDRLTDVDCVTISGPRGIGKDRIRKASNLPVVRAFTTRHKRRIETDGVEYDFVPTADHAHLIRAIREGRLVQYSMGISANEVYGTLASRYSHEKPAVLDIMYKELAKMRQLPFQSLKHVYLVSAYSLWMPRWEKRGPMDQTQIRDSFVEAEESLSAALQDDNITFLENTTVRETTTAFRAIVEGTGRYDAHVQRAARGVGEQLLGDIRRQLELRAA